MLRPLMLTIALMLPQATWSETRVPQSQQEIALGFAPLVKQTAPAVVNIYAQRIVEARRSPFEGDPFFEDFFRGFGQAQPRVQNSLGSGVILSSDGIVVSNFHVVGMATDIRVVLTDRSEYRARVLLGDQESDLAVLQLEGADGLPFLEFRNSDQVEVGELTLAIGNPFGVGQTVTSGIVSGLARSGRSTGNARGYFIQTDAAINPGNSGGALVDVNGDLIGINTSILSRSGGSNGIGFAIPTNLVSEFVRQARNGNSEFQRPWAGVTGQPITADLAESLGMTAPDGVVISDTHPLSPFVAAGIEVGDVITHVDGHPVNSPAEALFRMTVSGIGRTAEITRVRATDAADIDVQMIVAPDEPPANETRLGEDAVLPGLAVALVNPATMTAYGLPLDAAGVVVTNPGRFGARAGLKTGDIVLGINRAGINAPSDVDAALRNAGRRVVIDVVRQGRRIALRFRI